MGRVKTNEQVNEYCGLNRELNIQYDEYAKKIGMHYSSTLVLCIIYGHTENECTQKTICNETFLPKQTVNAIVTALWKQGLLKLTELVEDRRLKTITLTESGQEYAERIVPKIKIAENKAMDSLTEGERTALLETTRKFITRFREYMQEDGDL
jgi:DNA-binding MarR family transcriptional regulator